MHLEYLYEYSDMRISNTPKRLVRYLFDEINWESPLIGIRGARGTGKTTLLLQYLSKSAKLAPQVVYLSLDDLYFSTHSVLDTVSRIYKEGGEIIVLDEVHKYNGWAREVKNLYDHYPRLQIIFTGSSVIDIAREEGDLSRRAVLYELHGLSYREFLYLEHGLKFSPLTLTGLVDKNRDIRQLFPESFRPLQYFKEYQKYGYYPFFKSEPETYARRLQQVIRTAIEYDMAELKGFDIRNAKKLIQLLGIIAQSVPFKPNVSKLAKKSGIHRNSLVNYLHYLEQARLVHLLYPSGKSTATLQKPEKLFLNNPNLAWILSDSDPDTGNMRETFILSQLNVNHRVNWPRQGDFVVDDTFLFEVGGKNKSRKQISGQKNATLVIDDIEYPTAGRLPLWLFGFLY